MLYIIPTPIGNKDDITIRALSLLSSLQYLICEDIKTTKSLLHMYKINFDQKKFFSINSYITDIKFKEMISLISINDVGLVSEAGTPGLSDPGKELIKLLRINNLKFEVLPGANALIPCIVSSGFDTSKFIFLGYIPHKKGRNTLFNKIINSELPVFVYESVHRIEKTLLQLSELGFDGTVILCREVSKMFEQKVCKNIIEIIQMIKNGEIPLKGEFVLGFKN